MDNLVSTIFETISQAVTGMGTALGSAFSAITSLFYNSTDGLTFLGILGLISAGVGIVYLAFRVIRRLISLRVA